MQSKLKITGALAAMAIALGSLPVSTAHAEEAREPTIAVVKFHADWCGSCKAMGPVMDDLKNKFDGQNALFVTLDMTNESTSNDAELLAGALGLDGVWDKNAGSTGKIFIVDWSSKDLRHTLDKTMTFKEMSAKLGESLSSM